MDNLPRYQIYTCENCNKRIMFELDKSNLLYFKREDLYCKVCLYRMKPEVIREKEIIKENPELKES